MPIILSLFLIGISSFSIANDTYSLATRLSIKNSGDFADVSRLQNNSQIKNAEDFLVYWKQAKPEYFSNYVLGYRSRSLQQSSPLFPRALLFNTNADLVISFNGHKEHRGFKNIEMMRFNHESKGFEFYEMSFTKGQPHLSKANPKKCLACHQSSHRLNIDPRPNWEPYNVWPGFYGSLDDDTELFKDNYLTRKEFKDSGDEFLLAEFDAEKEWFYGYLTQTHPSHPRYSLLKGQLIDQYGDNGTLNGDLTNRLATLNFQRVARLIRTTNPNHYQMIKWTLWGQVFCGKKVFMPKEAFDWLYAQAPKSADYKRLMADREKAPLYRKINKSVMDAEGIPSDEELIIFKPSPYYSVKTSHIINVLFEAFGIDTEDWSMDFKTQGARFAAFERFGVTNDPTPPWREAIRNEVVKNDPDLQNLNCDQAREKSLEVFSSLEVTQHLQKQALEARPQFREKPLIQECASCHVFGGFGDIPLIPFLNPEQLQKALKVNGYPRGTLLDEILFRTGPHATEREQMPKRMVPTQKQKNELIQYLKKLAQD